MRGFPDLCRNTILCFVTVMLPRFMQPCFLNVTNSYGSSWQVLFGQFVINPFLAEWIAESLLTWTVAGRGIDEQYEIIKQFIK